MLAPLGLSGELYQIIGMALVYLGMLTLAVLVIVLILAVVVSALMGYSFKRDRFYFPGFILWTIIVMGGVVKAVFSFFRMDPTSVDTVGIELKNRVMLKKFFEVPVNERMILFPQCLRSVECPAPLTPEGIACVGCGRCGIGRAKKKAEELGYKVFVLPGSSAIKRLIKKYRPRAILGIGCIMEIREGLEMCHTAGLVAIGLMLENDGCVSTTLNWDAFYELIEDSEKK
ncbi:MAG: DUF116 domain-containing protein [Methermicoccaceae archaeon]